MGGVKADSLTCVLHTTPLMKLSPPFRRRFDPLWNSLVVGGVKADGTPFLGTVGMIGTAFTDVHVATGAAG